MIKPTKLETEGVVQLHDVNTALIDYHRETGLMATRLVLSPEARYQLGQITYCGARTYGDLICQDDDGREHVFGMAVITDSTLTGLVLWAE